MDELTEVHLAGEEGGTAFLEAIPARRIAPRTFVLLNSPAMVEGVAKGDTVEVHDSGAFSVLERSGAVCIWIYFADAISEKQREAVGTALAQVGLNLDSCGHFVVVCTADVSTGFEEIQRRVNLVVPRIRAESWMYGNIYTREGSPLNWWKGRAT